MRFARSPFIENGVLIFWSSKAYYSCTIRLEKIEQLTLYMIQMDKQVKALREENKALKERLKKLEH